MPTDPRILMAEMLISLGITGYKEIHDYLSQNGDDDAALAANLSELDARLLRRGITPPKV